MPPTTTPLLCWNPQPRDKSHGVLRVCLCFLLSHLLSPVHRRQKQPATSSRRRSTGRSRRVAAASRRSGRSARRAGPREARFVISRDSHIDCFLFVAFFFLTPFVNRQTWQRPVDGCGGAGSRTLQVRVLFSFMSWLPCLSQGLFFCMRCVRKRSHFLLLLTCRTIRRIRPKFLRVPSLVFFCCPFHCLLFLRTRQFVLQCLTGAHGAL